MSESGAERRKWPRIAGSSLGEVSASIVSGPDVRLVNISRGGALLEVGARYPMRAFVRLKLTRKTGETAVVPGTVSWARVGVIANGRINYLVAVVFEQVIADFAALTGYHAAETEAEMPVDDAPPAASDAADPAVVAVSAESIEPGDTADRAEPRADEHSHARLLAAEARAEHLRNELDAATTDLATLTLANDSLAAQLDESSLELNTLLEQMAEAAAKAEAQQAEHARLLAEREHWNEERNTLLEQMAEAVSKAAILQAALDAREQEHAATLAEEQARHDAIVAELVQATNDQHTEYQELLAAQAAAREGARARADALQADLVRQRAASARQRADLEARAQALEALCAAHEARYRTLQRDAEKLLVLLDSPVTATSQQEGIAPSPLGGKVAHAVA